MLLPFICILFYAYKSGPGKDTAAAAVGGDSLQTEISKVSEKVQNQGLSDKLDAFREKFKKGDGYTAVGNITEEELTVSSPSSLYNDREKRMLDSIDGAMKRKFSSVSQRGPSYVPPVISGGNRGYSKLEQDKALALALSKLNTPKNTVSNQPQERNAGTDPMQLFRAQMALVDSMGKANDPQYRAERERERQSKVKSVAPDAKPLAARKVENVDVDFNTVVPERETAPLSAVVDQDITGYASSRLRIRLLDDMLLGKMLIKKGSFLYATISGFSGQRVLLSVTSIFCGGQIYPARLDIYDLDGMAGIYVPASAFREFTRDLGGSSISGINLAQSENNNQLVMGVLTKMFQSTSTAVSKLIRSNKAKLKYNTLVYLIDPNELKKNQEQLH